MYQTLSRGLSLHFGIFTLILHIESSMTHHVLNLLIESSFLGLNFDSLNLAFEIVDAVGSFHSSESGGQMTHRTSRHRWYLEFQIIKLCHLQLEISFSSHQIDRPDKPTHRTNKILEREI